MALLSTRLLAEAGHDTTLYTFTHSPECFSDLQKNIKIEIHEAAKNTPFSPLKKLISIITLAWRLRHVDTIIANNPPMQIVAALAKVFNRKVHTLWWHHHTPWYIYNNRIKSFFERYLIVPFIDTMIATSHFVGERLKSYSGRDATVIHPVLDKAPQQTNKSNISDNDNNRVLLFTHGRLEPGKGIDTIVRVWEEMKKEHASSLPRRRESRPVSPDLHGPGYPPSRV